VVIVVARAAAADDAVVRVQEPIEECHRSDVAGNGFGLHFGYVASYKYDYSNKMDIL